ncbi:unnamed protein product [Sphagnum jensenii]|uniref:Uncharacterized protein n=1 Tax=Sphagnum jensenii TaxID=128206 RepID=A0ABP0V6P4_9BRYO
MVGVHDGLAELSEMAEVHGGLVEFNGILETSAEWRGCTVGGGARWSGRPQRNGEGAKKKRCKVVVEGKGAGPQPHGLSERSRRRKNAGQTEEGQARGRGRTFEGKIQGAMERV